MPRPSRIQEDPAALLQRQLSGMTDSVTLITEYIAEGVTSEEDVDALVRNYRHLEIMLEKENIATSGSDLSSYIAAVTAAKDYIATLPQ